MEISNQNILEIKKNLFGGWNISVKLVPTKMQGRKTDARNISDSLIFF